MAAAGLDRARRDAAAEADQVVESIAGAIRRIRGAGDSAEVLSALVDAATLFGGRAILLLRRGGTLMGFRAAGADGLRSRTDLARLSVDLASAPALAHAVESGDATVTAATQDKISRKLWKAFPFERDGSVHVYPLVLREVVLAVLLVDGASVRTMAIDSLVLTAEAWIEVLRLRQERGTKWS